MHILLGINRDTPFVIADEIGYLGNARYLAGVSHYPDLSVARFYHAGYSLFIVPAFRMFSDPFAVYRVVIIINAFLILSLYFAIYYLLHHLFRQKQKLSCVVAFVSCLYPAVQVHSNVAWAENMVIPLYAFIICSFGVLLNRRSYRASILFGALSGFLFTVHPRGLTILAICASAIAYLWFIGRLTTSKALLSLFTMGVLFAATIWFNNHFRSTGLNTGKYFHRLLSADGVKNYMLLLAGQILYVIQATYGLVIVGFMAMISMFRSVPSQGLLDRKTQHQRGLLFFILFTSIGLMVLMNIPMTYGIWRKTAGGIAIRADHLMYGRYAEPAVPIYIAFALLALRQNLFTLSRLYRILLVTVFLIASLTLLIHAGHGRMLATPRIAMVNLTGIYPVAALVGHLDIGLISLCAIFLFLILVALFRRSFLLGAAILSLFFSAIAFYDVQFYIDGRQKNMKARNSLPEHVRSLNTVETIAYDVNFLLVEHYLMYQYLLPEVQFHKFNSRNKENPPSRFVISSARWNGGRRLQAKLVACEPKNNHSCLWIVPEQRWKAMQ